MAFNESDVICSIGSKILAVHPPDADDALPGLQIISAEDGHDIRPEWRADPALLDATRFQHIHVIVSTLSGTQRATAFYETLPRHPPTGARHLLAVRSHPHDLGRERHPARPLARRPRRRRGRSAAAGAGLVRRRRGVGPAERAPAGGAAAGGSARRSSSPPSRSARATRSRSRRGSRPPRTRPGASPRSRAARPRRCRPSPPPSRPAPPSPRARRAAAADGAGAGAARRRRVQLGPAREPGGRQRHAGVARLWGREVRDGGAGGAVP